MISSDMIRGYNEVFILAILSQGDSYGYEISKKISEMTDEAYVIKETTLYSAFTRLKKNNLISSYPGVETEGGKRIYYKITKKGQENLEQKVEEWKLTQKVVEQILEKTRVK